MTDDTPSQQTFAALYAAHAREAIRTLAQAALGDGADAVT